MWGGEKASTNIVTESPKNGYLYLYFCFTFKRISETVLKLIRSSDGCHIQFNCLLLYIEKILISIPLKNERLKYYLSS